MRIKDLPVVTESSPDDQVPIDSGGLTRRIAASDFFDYVGTSAASAADASATAAAASETAAATSETNAAASATTAGTHATAAGTSETNAAASASGASTSEINAAASETAAASSASDASDSATAASGSATDAAGSATAAAGSATDAAASLAAMPGAATATPLMDGTAAVGTSLKYAREDHKHPSIVISVKNYGATGDGTTDDLAAIQAAVDANQTGAIYFGDASNTYKCSGPILLVDADGHNFQGRLISDGATITFTNAGTSTDTDADMQHGFQVYPVTNTTGSDISGAQNVTIEGFTINCPTNGAGIYLANSQRCSIINNTFNDGRYGLAMECCINTYVHRNTFSGYCNAGVGLIYSANTDVWYGGSGTASYWNDSPQIIGNGFSGTVTAGLAHILDMGSQSESIRNIQGNFFFSNSGCNQYGYLGRNCNPVLLSNWFEGVDYPIRFLNSNAGEGGSTTTITGVTAAQPGGTFTVGAFPDGFCFTARIENNFFARGVNDIDLSGVTGGPSQIGGNISQLLTGFHLVSRQSGSQQIIDSGDILVAADGGVYSSLAFPTRINLTGVVPWKAYTTTIASDTGSFTSAASTARYCVDVAGTTFFEIVILITTDGTSSPSNVQATLPSTPGNSHHAHGKNRVTLKTVDGSISASSATMEIVNYDGTYPGGDGALIVINGFYN